MAAAARRGARDVRLDRREERVLTGMVMTGSTVLRKIGGSRAGEIAAHRLLDHEDVTPQTTIAAAAERTREAARGHTVLLIQDTTEINFSGADRSRTGLGPAGDGKALGFFIHPLLAVSLEDEAVLGLPHAQIWSREAAPVAERKTRPVGAKESMRWLNATEASASLVGVAAEVIDVSDREGDIYQHFARRPEGVGMVVRAHHDRKLVGGGQMFAAAEGFGKGFVREVFVAPRGRRVGDAPSARCDKGRTAKVRVRAGTVEVARPATADPARDPQSPTLGLVEVIEMEPPAGKGVKPVNWRIVTTLEGKTERQKNKHPKGSLAWLAWVVARLGGWNCYYKPPGPKTMAAGWPRLAAMPDGFTLAQRARHVNPVALALRRLRLHR